MSNRHRVAGENGPAPTHERPEPPPAPPSTDGGSAFPHREYETRRFHHGMTLRQWYAGQAMKALIQRYGVSVLHLTGGFTLDQVAQIAGEQADAMLAAEGEPKRNDVASRAIGHLDAVLSALEHSAFHDHPQVIAAKTFANTNREATND